LKLLNQRTTERENEDKLIRLKPTCVI
jgi:hypothetical protein